MSIIKTFFDVINHARKILVCRKIFSLCVVVVNQWNEFARNEVDAGKIWSNSTTFCSLKSKSDSIFIQKKRSAKKKVLLVVLTQSIRSLFSCLRFPYVEKVQLEISEKFVKSRNFSRKSYLRVVQHVPDGDGRIFTLNLAHFDSWWKLKRWKLIMKTKNDEIWRVHNFHHWKVSVRMREKFTGSLRKLSLFDWNVLLILNRTLGEHVQQLFLVW